MVARDGWSGFTRRVPQLGLGRRRPRALTSWAPIASSAPMRQTRSTSPCSWADESARRIGGRAPGVLGMGVLVDAEGYRPLACQNVRLLPGHARLKIGHARGFGWLQERSDETSSDRLRDGAPREPSASLLDQVAQLGPGRRPAYRDSLQDLPKRSVHSRLLDTLAAGPSPSRTKCRTAPRSGAAPPSVTHTGLSNALSPFRQNATAERVPAQLSRAVCAGSDAHTCSIRRGRLEDAQAASRPVEVSVVRQRQGPALL
jgi:hypothetical protein